MYSLPSMLISATMSNLWKLGTVVLKTNVWVLNSAQLFFPACQVLTARLNGPLKDAGLFPWCRGWSLRQPLLWLLMLWPVPQPIRMHPCCCQLKRETKKVGQHHFAFNWGCFKSDKMLNDIFNFLPAVVVCYSYTSTTCTSTSATATSGTIGATVKSPRPPSPSSNVVVLPSGSTVYVKSECQPSSDQSKFLLWSGILTLIGLKGHYKACLLITNPIPVSRTNLMPPWKLIAFSVWWLKRATEQMIQKFSPQCRLYTGWDQHFLNTAFLRICWIEFDNSTGICCQCERAWYTTGMSSV